MEKIKGLIDAPFTPMHADGSINLSIIPEYASLLQRNGLKGVFINGSSGEGYMLTEDERKQYDIPTLQEYLDSLKAQSKTQWYDTSISTKWESSA